MSKSTLRTLIISVLMLVLSVAVFGFMAYQAIDQGKKLEEQLADLAAEQSQQNSFFKLQKIAEETTEERDQIRSLFLENESSSIDLLNRLESLAPQQGVSFETKELSEYIDEETNSKWIQTQFVFSGTKKQVSDFVKILENMPYVSRINSIDLKSDSGFSWQAEVSMQFRLLNYGG